jgi:acyl-CoA reductase-like NAD-dependent aldehyde dehydrogenase
VVKRLAPALAAGCAIVIKPAEQTPLSMALLALLGLEAGIPEGVINYVTGYGEEAGEVLVSHPGVDKISFTGSTDTGKLIARLATNTLKRVSLELGAAELESGQVWLNCYEACDSALPFGGYKESGWGRETCRETLDEYTELKTVVLSLGPA